MDDMQSRGRRTHPCPAGGHRRQLWFGVLLAMMSPVVLLPGADLLGFELPSALQWTLAVFATGLGLRLTIWAWQRARTDEPAVAVRGPQLHLHAHPDRRITLHGADILGVEPVRELTGFGPGGCTGRRGSASSPAPVASARCTSSSATAWSLTP